MTMIKRNSKLQILAQRGYAMLGIIAAVGVAATALVVTSLSATAVRNDQGRKTSSALAIAKQALIASAAFTCPARQALTAWLPSYFAVVERRVAKEVQNALQTYFTNTSGKLPWYAPACTGNVTVSCPAVNPKPALPSRAAALPAAGTSGYIPTDDANLNAALPSWFRANNWNSVMTYRVDSDCAAGLPTYGAAFAGFTAGGGDSVLIGFSAGTATTGTKAVLSFGGVNTLYSNYQTTVLKKAAVQ